MHFRCISSLLCSEDYVPQRQTKEYEGFYTDCKTHIYFPLNIALLDPAKLMSMRKVILS